MTYSILWIKEKERGRNMNIYDEAIEALSIITPKYLDIIENPRPILEVDKELKPLVLIQKALERAKKEHELSGLYREKNRLVDDYLNNAILYRHYQFMIKCKNEEISILEEELK